MCDVLSALSVPLYIYGISMSSGSVIVCLRDLCLGPSCKRQCFLCRT